MGTTPIDTAPTPLDKRCRDAKPERLTIGGETFVRNDVVAREHGVCERTINRDDKHGAPFLLIGSVKYRPQGRYHEFLLSRIRQHKPPRGRKHRA
jgi:hypothetical protein